MRKRSSHVQHCHNRIPPSFFHDRAHDLYDHIGVYNNVKTKFQPSDDIPSSDLLICIDSSYCTQDATGHGAVTHRPTVAAAGNNDAGVHASLRPCPRDSCAVGRRHGRLLRRDILSPAFIRRVCQHGPNGGIVPPFLVGYLRVHNNAGEKRTSCFSLVHPATPAATSFSEDHLAPFLSRRAAADLSRRYMPQTSRNGLAVLRRGSSAICVYDPMTGKRAYLSRPLDICRYGVCTYVLLTAADGIGCSFFLLATDSSFSCIQLCRRPRRLGSPPNIYILTYDVPRHGTRAATTTGSIEVPKACLPGRCEESDLHLTSSPNGRLCLLVADRFTISIWLLSGSTDWARQSVIDTEAIVRSMSPKLLQSEWPSKVDFVRSAGLRSGAVLLRPFMSWDFLDDKGEKGLLLLDVGTEEMRRVDKKEGFPYEVDMEARLSAMKIFD
ncbi:unnamed protein product [Miscanthus lutarioriparius]|uniref:DUF7595 domain-containing protein n=1 Tax=Miscanthus lutarioriparius TaxID=422564 RepID=A0A811MR74_9POAL|nr:unnamed protein product [Miscanthus lutarioriparius]